MNVRDDSKTEGNETQDSIEVREMEFDDCKKIMEIDHTEVIKNIFVFTDGRLMLKKEHWDIPDWSKEEKEQKMVKGAEAYIDDPDLIQVGAFHSTLMVGYTSTRPISLKNRERMWEVGWLIVSNSHRRCGIATRMMELTKKKVVEAGGEAICLLGTPAECAVRFYLSVGFEPLDVPDDEHWSWWDGEDIYMEMKL